LSVLSHRHTRASVYIVYKRAHNTLYFGFRYRKTITARKTP